MQEDNNWRIAGDQRRDAGDEWTSGCSSQFKEVKRGWIGVDDKWLAVLNWLRIKSQEWMTHWKQGTHRLESEL